MLYFLKNKVFLKHPAALWGSSLVPGFGYLPGGIHGPRSRLCICTRCQGVLFFAFRMFYCTHTSRSCANNRLRNEGCAINAMQHSAGWVLLPVWVNRQTLAVPSRLPLAHSNSSTAHLSPALNIFYQLLPLLFSRNQTRAFITAGSYTTRHSSFVCWETICVCFFILCPFFNGEKTPPSHLPSVLSLFAAVMVVPACLSLHFTPCLPVQAKGMHSIRREQVQRC